LQKTLEFKANDKLIILLRISIEPTITPNTWKDFQKREMIYIKAIFFSTNPGVISRKVGVFPERRGL
jgi:hypothetical protein